MDVVRHPDLKFDLVKEGKGEEGEEGKKATLCDKIIDSGVWVTQKFRCRARNIQGSSR